MKCGCTFENIEGSDVVAYCPEHQPYLAGGERIVGSAWDFGRKPPVAYLHTDHPKQGKRSYRLVPTDIIARLTRERDEAKDSGAKASSLARHLDEIDVSVPGDGPVVDRVRQTITSLTRELAEARAEVRACCGEPEALDPYLPPSGARTPPPMSHGWWRADLGLSNPLDDRSCVRIWDDGFWSAQIGRDRRVAYNLTPLAAMRAADAAGEVGDE